MDSTKDGNTKDPFLPPLHRVGDMAAPRAPQKIVHADLPDGALVDLAAKLAFTVARFTNEWVAERLHLSQSLAIEVLEQLCREGWAEESLRTSGTHAHYRITDRGREHAIRTLETNGYIGPAPVRLEAYSAMLRWQFANTPPVKPKHVVNALSELVLPTKSIQLAGLAVSSGRSLFVYGPPGNGKSSIGQKIHQALSGDYWIPYCVSVGNAIIRIYDEQVHKKVDLPDDQAESIDKRWIRIRRPLVVVGGELTLEMLDLVYSPTLKYYEAPAHLKSNGGVFLIDDFGRERISPTALLNRFITPMEHQIDYFTLSTSQKIQIPLRHVLIIATNLDPSKVTDPAFLRRMGYRMYLGPPTEEAYREIFHAYAKKHGVEVEPAVLDHLLEKYRKQGRELRSCEPRDLIERSFDICRFQSLPLQLNKKVLELAWIGYFGSSKILHQEPTPPEDDDVPEDETE